MRRDSLSSLSLMDNCETYLWHLSVSDDLGHRRLDQIDRDRKADTSVSPRRGSDRCVDTNELSPTVDQWSATAPGIDRSVGLDDTRDRSPIMVRVKERERQREKSNQIKQ